MFLLLYQILLFLIFCLNLFKPSVWKGNLEFYHILGVLNLMPSSALRNTHSLARSLVVLMKILYRSKSRKLSSREVSFVFGNKLWKTRFDLWFFSQVLHVFVFFFLFTWPVCSLKADENVKWHAILVFLKPGCRRVYFTSLKHRRSSSCWKRKFGAEISIQAAVFPALPSRCFQGGGKVIAEIWGNGR